jgi:sensor histidine kinase YesM
MIESEEYKSKNILIKQQFEMQLTHIKNIDSIYLGIRKVVHDMNNHISCLKSLADANNWDEMKKYLYKISNTVSKLDFKIKTGNPICDAIINEKYNISQAEGINFQCEFLIPQNTSLDSIDLCVLLSNALDNSIEACKKINGKHKFILIKSYVRGLYLIIEIINSSSEKLSYNDDKIITSKADKINHGIGLSNIEDVVNKYNGAFDIIEEQNQVTLSLMLKAY